MVKAFDIRTIRDRIIVAPHPSAIAAPNDPVRRATANPISLFNLFPIEWK